MAQEWESTLKGADVKNQPNMQISFVRGGWFVRYMTGLLKSFHLDVDFDINATPTIDVDVSIVDNCRRFTSIASIRGVTTKIHFC